MRSIEAAWLEILPGRSVSSIVEEYTFHSCSALTSITGLEAVTSIYASAFRECTALTSITGLASVTSISGYAFYGSGLAGDFAWPVG